MKLGKEKKKWEGKFLRIIEKKFTSDTGKDYTWECVERTNCDKIVAIFAVTPEKELVMVKQFRLPVGNYVVEIPAGLADKDGEHLEGTARRELQEETGYTSEEMIEIISGPFNSGMSGEEMTIFFAPNAKLVGFEGVHADDEEEIEVIKTPLSDLVDFCVKDHDNFVVDIKILAIIKILEKKNLI